jgi:hypothetical protein
VDYGLTGLHSFLDTSIDKPTLLRRALNPKEECLFYIVLLIKVPDNGAIRTGFVLKGHDFFYKVSTAWPNSSGLISCGHCY